MNVTEVLMSLAIAAGALYGLGIPLAWMLPAPADCQWIHRIAIGPLYAIVLGTGASRLLGVLGMSLHPLQLWGLVALVWALAWWRTREEWDVRQSLRLAVGPALIVGTAGLVWIFSLVGYGLYLPNRDFKNHAYFVAQVAFSKSSDPSLVLRASPISPPSEGAFYPLGLHTVLGWALPTADWNSLGVTAAAAIICTAVSLPLAVMALARQFLPGNRLVWVVAGLAASCFPGVTSPFQIGSVVLLAGTALYAAGLAGLWQWVTSTRSAEFAAHVLAGVGLFFLHVAEAWGLALVTIASLPFCVRHGSQPRKARIGWPIALALSGLSVALVALRRALPNLFGSGFEDIEPNRLSIPEAVLFAFLSQPGGRIALSLVWTVLVVVGVWLTISRRLSMLPIVALIVPIGLAVLASVAGVPRVLNLLTAPWYGSTGRVYLMAAAPMALLGSLAIAAACGSEGARRDPEGDGRETRPLGGRALVGLGFFLAVLALWTVQIVGDRRGNLAAALAGAGDTPALARGLRDELQPGETVLTFEGDGTANLFAAARLPVISGWDELQLPPKAGLTVEGLLGSLMQLDSREVAEALAALHVRFISLGTGSVYWGSETGYSVRKLLEQPELTVHAVGSDMTILEYSGSTNG